MSGFVLAALGPELVEELLPEFAAALALLEAGWAELLSGVAALSVLLQPARISPNASTMGKLCFIIALLRLDVYKVRCGPHGAGWRRQVVADVAVQKMVLSG
jgi:hypothetical protein